MTESTYAAIGGQETVEAVVRDFYQMVCYDEQLSGYFADTDMDSLRSHQAEFLGAVAGGPVDYSGMDMTDAHRDLDIDQSDFTLIVEYLENALVQNGVSETHISEILSTVVTFEDAVVDNQ